MAYGGRACWTIVERPYNRYFTSCCYGLAAVGNGHAARELSVVFAGAGSLAGLFFGAVASRCFFAAIVFAGAFTLTDFLLGVELDCAVFVLARAFGAVLPP